MRMARWIIGLVILAAVVALLIVFWPKIMEAGQRYLSRRRSDRTGDFDDAPVSA